MENSQDERADPRPDLGSLLPREVFQEAIFILSHTLPPPFTGDPVDEARRDRVAMAGVAALWPVNAAEARLAAEYVATGAWVSHCLRLAYERDAEFEVARKCRAQAMSMMREGKSTLRMLLKLQEVRKATEADPVAAGRAEWVEHCALEIMAEVLSEGPLGGEAAASAEAAPAADGAGSEPAVAENLDTASNAGIPAEIMLAETPARPAEARFWRSVLRHRGRRRSACENAAIDGHRMADHEARGGAAQE